MEAFFGNPNVARQGKKARELAAARDVNTLPDPQTYAFVSGLLGTAPDEQGFSVMQPNADKIRAAGEKGMAMGLLTSLSPLTKGLPVGASIKPASSFPQSEALETARKNAVKMLGLPENNTPAMRAAALGFDAPAVHFSRHGIDTNVLDSGKYAMSPFDAVGTHVGSPQAALERFRNTVATTDQIKGSTYPVLIKQGRQFTDNGATWAEEPLSMKLREMGGHDTARKTYPELNAELRGRLTKDFDSIPYVNDVEAKGQISYIVPPQNIRSRFAAFDPARVNENDLLGAATPGFLSLLGAGAGGGVAYANTEDGQARINKLRGLLGQ